MPSAENQVISSHTTTAGYNRSSTTPYKEMSNGRARASRRPGTTTTSLTGLQDIICAITESRGISPIVGLAFVNISTCEAVLCQICDSQTYVRTLHKIKVFNPTEILYSSTSADSKFLSVISENMQRENGEIMLTAIDRKYWSETSGHEFVQQLAFPEDLESLRISLSGNYFAACCLGAVCGKTSLFILLLMTVGYEVCTTCPRN